MARARLARARPRPRRQGLARNPCFGQCWLRPRRGPRREFVKVRILRLVLLGLAALAAIIAGTALLKIALRGEPPPTPVTATIAPPAGDGPNSVESVRRISQNMLKGAPEYAVFFDRLKAAFPSEYEAFLKTVAERSAAS